jgi:hypothetical protein
MRARDPNSLVTKVAVAPLSSGVPASTTLSPPEPPPTHFTSSPTHGWPPSPFSSRVLNWDNPSVVTGKKVAIPNMPLSSVVCKKIASSNMSLSVTQMSVIEIPMACMRLLKIKMAYFKSIDQGPGIFPSPACVQLVENFGPRPRQNSHA